MRAGCRSRPSRTNLTTKSHKKKKKKKNGILLVKYILEFISHWTIMSFPNRISSQTGQLLHVQVERHTHTQNREISFTSKFYFVFKKVSKCFIDIYWLLKLGNIGKLEDSKEVTNHLGQAGFQHLKP
jgi:hypothetical protein